MSDTPIYDALVWDYSDWPLDLPWSPVGHMSDRGVRFTPIVPPTDQLRFTDPAEYRSTRHNHDQNDICYIDCPLYVFW